MCSKVASTTNPTNHSSSWIALHRHSSSINESTSNSLSTKLGIVDLKHTCLQIHRSSNILRGYLKSWNVIRLLRIKRVLECIMKMVENRIGLKMLNSNIYFRLYHITSLFYINSPPITQIPSLSNLLPPQKAFPKQTTFV